MGTQRCQNEKHDMSRTIRNKARVPQDEPLGSVPEEPRELAAAAAADPELTGLEHHRDRFRRAALLCVRVLNRVADKFEQIAGGNAPIDPHVDVYSSPELKL